MTVERGGSARRPGASPRLLSLNDGIAQWMRRIQVPGETLGLPAREHLLKEGGLFARHPPVTGEPEVHHLAGSLRHGVSRLSNQMIECFILRDR